MKAKGVFCKTLYSIVAICMYFAAYSQAPQGFSYQAVIRNNSGLPVANKTVGIRITLEDASHVAYYTETHAPTTNSQGVFSVIIGNGNQVGNNLFENIPWSKGDVSMKIEVDPEGGTAYALMGNATQLQAVPYALYAENTKEVVSQQTALDDDPIFVVKNKAGQTVFAVYQTGVRVYVEDTPVLKGARGGFAVGGLSQSKVGTGSEFFRITSDSARIYVKNPLKKGARGGFAVGGLSQSKGSDNFMQLTPDNYFIGFESGLSITSGLYNSFLGYQSGKFTTSGGFNVFSGYQSGLNNTEGSSNVFLGYASGISNTTGFSNNFIGEGAGYSNTTGTNGIFIGNDAGYNNTTASGNIFIGRNSGYAITGTDANTYWGNVFIGNLTGSAMTTGSTNLIAGVNAAQNKTSGNNNVILGSYAAYNNGDGNYNTIIGAGAGNNAAGSYNVFLGYNAGYGETGSNKLYISNSSGSNPLIGGDFSTHKVTMNYMLNLTAQSSIPSSPTEGDIVRFKSCPSSPINSVDGVYIFTGTTWKAIVTW